MKQNDFNIIRDKYHYEESLGDFLEQVYEAFLLEFGEDYRDIIYNAFLNTPVSSCSNIYQGLKNRNMLSDNFGLVKEADLRRASGVYQSYPNIEYNNGKYFLKSVDRVVLIQDLDLSKEQSKSTLIHELGHLIKSYQNEFKIDDDVLTTRSGLMETKEKLSYQDNKVTREMILERGVGLEEGLNSVLEEKICKKLIHPDYEVKGYGIINVLADNTLNMLDCKNEVYQEQMLKNNDLNTTFKGVYADFLKVMDKMYYLTLKLFGNAFNSEEMHKTSDEMKYLLETEFRDYADIFKGKTRG